MSSVSTGFKKVLITGGTSGLGLSLAKYYLAKGCYVFVTGRQDPGLGGFGERCILVRTDFSDLKQTSEAIKRICSENRFDLVINNAGILSPPEFMLTGDGLEYTFQVNFLAHLMLNEIIIRTHEPERRLVIAAVVSVAYRIAGKDLKVDINEKEYRPFKAYSESKLYLALMCSYLKQKYHRDNLTCVGFDPGIFRSGIYRMQKKWFRILYRIGAPFMTGPGKIAEKFGSLQERNDLVNGAVYRPGKPGIEPDSGGKLSLDSFWSRCMDLILPYIS